MYVNLRICEMILALHARGFKQRGINIEFACGFNFLGLIDSGYDKA